MYHQAVGVVLYHFHDILVPDVVQGIFEPGFFDKVEFEAYRGQQIGVGLLPVAVHVHGFAALQGDDGEAGVSRFLIVFLSGVDVRQTTPYLEFGIGAGGIGIGVGNHDVYLVVACLASRIHHRSHNLGRGGRIRSGDGDVAVAAAVGLHTGLPAFAAAYAHLALFRQLVFDGHLLPGTDAVAHLVERNTVCGKGKAGHRQQTKHQHKCLLHFISSLQVKPYTYGASTCPSGKYRRCPDGRRCR